MPVGEPHRSGALLWISHEFAPADGVGGLRISRLIREAARSGCSSVLIAGPSRAGEPKAAEPRGEPSGSPEVVRVLGRPSRIWARLAARLDRREESRRRRKLEWGGAYAGAWVESAVAEALARLHGASFRAVVSSAPPHSAHEIAHRIREATGLAWIMDVRDPWWPEAHPASESFRRDRLARWCRSAAGAVATTPEVLDRLPLGDCPARVVPNGYDDEECPCLASAWPPARFCLLHTGSLYEARRIDDVLEALSRLVARGAVDPASTEVVSVGRRYAPVRIPENLRGACRFEDPLPRPLLLAHWKRSAVLLLLQPEAYAPCIPTKLYEYVALGRPLLAVVPEDSASARFLRQREAGRIVPPGDPEALERALEDLYRSWKEGTLAPPGRPPGFDRFEWRRAGERFLDFVEELAPAGIPRRETG